MAGNSSAAAAKRKRAAADKGRDMPLREDGQVYARVTHMLGNGRVTATCDDGQVRMCKIRGAMRKREWVRVGDTVLVALRSFQDQKADLIFKFDDGEVRRLQRLGETAELNRIAHAHADSDEDAAMDCVDFDQEDALDWERI